MIKVGEQYMSHYDFVPVDTTRPSSIPRQLFTSRKDITVAFTWKTDFRTESAVHVGSGKKSIDKSQQMYPVEISLNYRLSDGTLAIPGSTFKGMLRANFHILTMNAGKTAEVFGTSTREQSAIAKVYLYDLVPTIKKNPVIQRIHRQWGPRRRKSRHIKIYTGLALPPQRRPNVALEVIPPETILTSEGVYIGDREWELGGILYAMGLHVDQDAIKSRIVKLGHAKPQGFGRLRAIVDEQSPHIRCFDFTTFPPRVASLTQDDIVNALTSFERGHLKQHPRNVEKLFRG